MFVVDLKVFDFGGDEIVQYVVMDIVISCCYWLLIVLYYQNMDVVCQYYWVGYCVICYVLCYCEYLCVEMDFCGEIEFFVIVDLFVVVEME